MTDEATELLVDILSAEGKKAGKVWDELQRIAHEQPERIDTIDTVIQTTLEKITRQLQAGTIEEQRGLRWDDTKEAFTALSTPTSPAKSFLPERAIWTLTNLAVDFHDRLSYQGAIEPLSQLCQVQHMGIRCYALIALATIGGRKADATPIAIDHVRAGLESEYLLERATAAWSATQLMLCVPSVGGLHGHLRTALGDKSRFVRRNAAEAIFSCQFHGYGEPRFNRADAYSLVDGAASLSVVPVCMLAEAGLGKAAEQAQNPTAGYSRNGIKSIYTGHEIVDDIQAELQVLADSPASKDRAAAAAALGFIGPGFGQSTDIRDRAVPVLNRLLDDESETVRRVVEWLYEDGPNRWHSGWMINQTEDLTEPRRLRVVDTLEDDRGMVERTFTVGVFSIEGSESTVCSRRAITFDDTMIALDDYQQANAGVKTGDMVTVQSTTPLDAIAVTLRPPANLSNAAVTEVLATTPQSVSGISVAAGEVFRIRIAPEKLDVDAPDCGEDERVVYDVPFEVVETIPEKPVVIKERTDLFIDPEPAATVNGCCVQHAEPVVKANRSENQNDDVDPVERIFANRTEDNDS